jgi:uncharacterized protein YciI
MLFVGIAHFRPNSQKDHDALRSAFTEHLGQPLNPRIKLAGAIFDDAGERCGIFMMFESDSIETVRSYLAASPYQISGLYESAAINSVQLEVGHV